MQVSGAPLAAGRQCANERGPVAWAGSSNASGAICCGTCGRRQASTCVPAALPSTAIPGPQRTMRLVQQCAGGRPCQHAVCRAVAAAHQAARLLDDCGARSFWLVSCWLVLIVRGRAMIKTIYAPTMYPQTVEKSATFDSSCKSTPCSGYSPEKHPASMRKDAVEAAVNPMSDRCCSTASTLPTAAPEVPAGLQIAAADRAQNGAV